MIVLTMLGDLGVLTTGIGLILSAAAITFHGIALLMSARGKQ